MRPMFVIDFDLHTSGFIGKSQFEKVYSKGCHSVSAYMEGELLYLWIISTQLA